MFRPHIHEPPIRKHFTAQLPWPPRDHGPDRPVGFRPGLWRAAFSGLFRKRQTARRDPGGAARFVTDPRTWLLQAIACEAVTGNQRHRNDLVLLPAAPRPLCRQAQLWPTL